MTTKQGTIVGRTYLCNFAIEITMDICKVVHQIKPDIIVIATSNPDFVSLIQEVRKSGIRIEVASFEEETLTDMQLKCSGFINLTMYCESYQAAQNDEQSEDGVEEKYQSLIQAQELLVGHKPRVDVDRDRVDLALQEIDDIEQVTQQQTMGGLDAPSEGLA